VIGIRELTLRHAREVILKCLAKAVEHMYEVRKENCEIVYIKLPQYNR